MQLQVNQQTWTALGVGSAEGHVAIAASGQSGGIILAWKEDQFNCSCTWTGRHMAEGWLVNRRDSFSAVVAPAYGPVAPTLRSELWEDLVQLHGAFPGSPILIGRDFNVTLTTSDRPNDGGGRDPGFSQFREVIVALGLAEIGPSDRRFTWKGPTPQSRLDHFLCYIELLAAFPLVEVTTFPRPLSDHTSIVWAARVGSAKSTYFKLDRSWLRDRTLKNEILEWWGSRLTFGAASE